MAEKIKIICEVNGLPAIVMSALSNIEGLEFSIIFSNINQNNKCYINRLLTLFVPALKVDSKAEGFNVKRELSHASSNKRDGKILTFSNDCLQLMGEGIVVNLNGEPFIDALPSFQMDISTKDVVGCLEIVENGNVLLSLVFSPVRDSIKQTCEKVELYLSRLLELSLVHNSTTLKEPLIPVGLKQKTKLSYAKFAKFFLTLAVNKISSSFSYRFHQEKWRVALSKSDPLEVVIGKGIENPWVHEFAMPGNDYIADPFILNANSGEWLLVEYYDHEQGKGLIKGRSLSKKNSQYETLMDMPGHHSYPFVFECNGSNYLIPEHAASAPQQIYKIAEVDNNIDISPLLILNADELIYDPTIIKYGGKYWLFGNVKGCDTYSELGLWYSSDGCTAWARHKYFPLTIDIRCGRPAGRPVFKDGKPIIFLQNSSNRYGGCIEVFAIDKLTTEDLTVRHVNTLNAHDIGLSDKAILGMHTLSWGMQTVAVDYLERENRVKVAILNLLKSGFRKLAIIKRLH